MQKRIQILILFVGLICAASLQSQAPSQTQSKVLDLIQKGELKGNAQEGTEGIALIKKMIKDLEEEDKKIMKDAKKDHGECLQKQEDRNCIDDELWDDEVDKKEDEIARLEKQNDTKQKQIENWLNQKKKEQADFDAKKKETQNTIGKDYTKIINMIKKIIKVMVQTYKITSKEDLTNVFLQTNSLIQMQQKLSNLKTTDMFTQISANFMKSTIQSLIEKKYDTASAKKFVSLMETLIEKLRQKSTENKENFKFDDKELKKSLSNLDELIRKARAAIKVNEKKIKELEDYIEKGASKQESCSDIYSETQKCETDFVAAKKLVGSNDDLINILKQVLKDTQALQASIE